MDRQTALLELATGYAVALRVHDAGAADDSVAQVLGIPIESVAGLLRVAEAKLAALLADPAGSRGPRNGSVSRRRFVDSLRRLQIALRLTMQQRQLALRLKARGLSLRQIAREVGCSHQGATLLVTGGGHLPGRPDPWVPGAGRLQLSDREEISLSLQRGDTLTAIAGRIGRATSTVSREVSANGGRRDYRAWRGHMRAGAKARRPKTPKLARPALAAQVTEWLEDFWSPEEIARRLRIDFGGDPMMWVSHETICQSLFVQGRGELRSGRSKRRPKHGLRTPANCATWS